MHATNDGVYYVSRPSTDNLASPILSWSPISGVYRLDSIAAKETLGIYGDPSLELPFSSVVTALAAEGNMIATGGIDDSFVVNRLAKGPQPLLRRLI